MFRCDDIWPESSKEVSFQILDRFKATGGNFIDTANVYSTGVSETVVGSGETEELHLELVIATTKCVGRWGWSQ